jgi:membrane protein CcdC involved in cytochrome C biogenesis
MKNKAIIIPAIFLIVTIGNYFRIVPNSSVRAVDFLNIWAIGALSGVLIFQIAQAIKERKK